MRAILAALASLTIATTSSARDLFIIDTNAGASGSGNSVVDLLDDLLNQTGAFSSLAAQPTYTATVDYLGVRRALVLDLANNGMDLTLTIPSTGVVVPFTAASPAALENQVEDWLEQNGASAWANFLQSMSGNTPLALLDGNPRATTALMANSAYRRFGLHDSHSRLGYMEQEVSRFGGFGITLEVGGGSVSTDQFDDLSSVDGSLELSGEFNDKVGMSFALIGQFRDYQGAELYDVGLELGLPVRLRRPVDGDKLYWAVTPVFQAAAGASVDAAAGGLFLGGGFVNAVAQQLGIVEVGMANELLYYGGIPINNISGFDFKTELDQLVMKNGLRVTVHPINLVYAEAGLTFTNFLLEHAALNWYATPFIGAGLRLGQSLELRASYESDIGRQDYRGHRGRLEVGAHF